MARVVMELMGIGKIATITHQDGHLVYDIVYPAIEGAILEIVQRYKDKKLPLLYSDVQQDGIRHVGIDEPEFLHALGFEINCGYTYGRTYGNPTILGKSLFCRIE